MKIKHLALIISTILTTSSSVYAAQKDDAHKATDEDIEIIEVRGVLSSLKEAQEIKKLADNIVDALVAEDIGKFPDSNVAEALQRIPGVSVSRVHGEGQSITVRGLTGDYNVTTLNGRKIASEAVGRDFNYDLIASELIGGVQINKTQQAKLPEGGIGAVINIETRKPLDIGHVVSASLEGYYNERSEKTSPQASFLVSDTFSDDTVGVLFSMNHTESKTRFDSHSAQWGWGQWNMSTLLPDQGYTDETVRFPNWPNITVSTDDRERTGGTVAIQWLPTENLDINFDALYTKYEIVSTGHMISLALFEGTNLDNIQHVTVGEDGRGDSITIGEPGNMDSPAIAELLEDQHPRESDTLQLGLNVNYIYDNFTFNVDAAYSEAEDASAEESWIVIRTAIDTLSMNWDNGYDVPDITFGDTVLDENIDYGAWYSRLQGDKVKDKTGHFVFDGEYEFYNGVIKKILFGAGYSMQDKGKTFWNQKNASAFTSDDMSIIDAPESEQIVINGNTMWGPLPSSALNPSSFNNFMGNSGANLPDGWAGININGLFDYYRSLDNEAFEEYLVPRPSLEGGNTYGIKEETTHAYAEIIIDDMLMNMPYILDFGVRYIKTEVSSWGYSQNPANIAFDEHGKLLDSYKKTGYVSFDGSYEKLLPSMNFKMSLTDDVVFRFALSQAMSRPPLTNLSPATSISQNETTLQNFMYQNDPGLKPYYADQFDTAIEWYYSDKGNLNFATFYKELHGFIVYEPNQETLAGHSFEVTSPYNDKDNASRIRGYEVNWLQSFDEFLPSSLTGFGMSANYTFNNSESGQYDGDDNELPFRGLSKNQYNIVAFYENHGLMVNLAYNYRSEYSLGTVWSPLMPSWNEAAIETLEVDEWGALDLSASYQVNDNVTVTFDANNLLDPDFKQYIDGDKSFVDYLSSWGTSYRAGIRIKF